MPFKHYACYLSGQCMPNPGGNMGIGAFILNPDRNYVFKHSEYVKGASLNNKTSNHVSEYMAAIALLKFLDSHKLHTEEIIIGSCSELIVNQMNLQWTAKKGDYKPYYEKARILVIPFTNITWKRIPKEKNNIAEALALAAILEYGNE